MLLLVKPVDQEIFLSQALSEEIEQDVVPFPYPETQTRDFVRRFAQAAGQLARAPRVVLWNTSLGSNPAQNVIRRFTSSTGMPMEPSAWATVAAVKIIAAASFKANSSAVDELIQELETSSFNLYKGIPLSFHTDDPQLMQPLYLTEIDPSVV